MQQKQIPSIQALRAIAAILVLLFHFTNTINEFGFSMLGNIFSKGNSGVDIFFVISGFIIFFTVKQRANYSVKDFLISRAIRIYPIYWAVVIILILAELLGLSNDPYRLDAGTIIRSMALLPGEPYMIGIEWTLTVELIFYIFFALTFFFSEKIFLFGMAVWGLMSLWSEWYLPVTAPLWISTYLLYPRNIEFLYGIVVAFIYLRKKNLYGKYALVIGLIFFAIAMGNTFFDPTKLAFIRALGFGLPAAFLLYGLITVNIKTPKTLVHLGNSSYLLYLIHATVLSVVLRVFTRVINADMLQYSFVQLALLVIPVLAALIGHYIFERPLLHRIRLALTIKGTTANR